MFIPKTTRKSNKAFAVLFSIMLAIFLITLGISIFSISLKEIQITTSVRDSQIAYYAADSARECALYWDVKKGAFPTCLSDDCSENTTADQISDIVCNGNTINVAFTPPTSPSTKYITKSQTSPTIPSDKITNFFRTSATNDVLPVADLRITKEWITATQGVRTTIERWGHNTAIVGRRVERGIKQVNN